jgi:NaMN:DMB phosphoribosyltransferase
MPEPLSAGAATLVMTGVAVPMLTAFGVPLGLRTDVLLAGFLGAIAAIALLNTVPSTGDTWQQLVRTTWRRCFVSIASAVTAGYIVPTVVNDHAALANLLSIAFVVGAGAQKFLAVAIERFGSKDGKP